MSLDPSKHGFKIEEVGSEAELANKSIDVRVPEFQDDFDLDKYKKNPHDRDSVDDAIKKDRLDSNREDRLGLVRKSDVLNTIWSRNFIISDRSETVAEPAWPFAQGEPIYAFYANDARSVLTFFLRQPDDTVESHTIDKAPTHEAAWHHLRKIFSQDDLDRNTKREIDKINAGREEEEARMKEQEDKLKQERLFQLKVDAFEMDIVNDSSSRELKSMIRKAKSELEVFGAIGALYAQHFTTKDDEVEDVAAAE
jgi:hypothetical protein|tara:strand:- start:472 stop:1230 length:759 start_codon:yes stop_codon:yes gene_type:complete